jgi:hypothetical protein
MFNSASVAIGGNETMSCELRVRTCIELNLNFEFYQTHFHYENFKLVYDLEEASLECAIDGEYSSIFAMQALASVLGREIMSVYPAMNGMLDKSISILNVVLHPRISTFRNKSKDRLYLMWNRCSGTLPRQRNRTTSKMIAVYRIQRFRQRKRLFFIMLMENTVRKYGKIGFLWSRNLLKTN